MAGVGPLTRLAVRRDRLLVGVGVLLLVGVCAASATATGSLYATAPQQVAAAEAINASPAVVALYGPILDTSSFGELAMTKMTVLYAVLVAALLVVVVRRHTRTEEESGRAELLAGTAMDRAAPLAAAAFEGIGVSLLVGAVPRWSTSPPACPSPGRCYSGPPGWASGWSRRGSPPRPASSRPAPVPAPQPPRARSECCSCSARSATPPGRG